MGILKELQTVEDALHAAVRGLDPQCLAGDEAVVVLDLFARCERLCAAGRTLASRRAADSGQWRAAGERSAAHWMARRNGISIGSAATTLETADRLRALPEVEEAVRAGRLSDAQAREIASAAPAAPESQAELLDAAERHGWQGLRDACRRVAAAAIGDEAESRQRAIHRGRYLKIWQEADGAARMSVRLTCDAMAYVSAGLEDFEADIFAAARSSGHREPYHAYLADALVAMAGAARKDSTMTAISPHGSEACASEGAGAEGRNRTRSDRAATVVHVLVDHSALVRGYTIDGETSEIAGIGPVPVATVKAMMSDAYLAAIVTDGVDVYRIAHLGRTVTAHQRSALEVRDRECVVPGCHVARNLEIDHIEPWAATKITKLDSLARLCSFHHAKKTHEGYTLHGPPGNWTWTPPGDASGAESPPSEQS
jgi:hypothetical protein